MLTPILLVGSLPNGHTATAQVEDYLGTFSGTNEQVLFLSKSLVGIDTDKKDAKGEKYKLSKAVLCVSSRMTLFTKSGLFNKTLSVRTS